MSASTSWQGEVAQRLSGHRAQASCARWSPLGASAWSSSWSLELDGTKRFVKIADRSKAGMLAAEAEGLRAIAATSTVRVPAVIAVGEEASAAFLALEWLDIEQAGRDGALGRALAAMHAHTAQRFGWYGDNTIGATSQRNDWSDDWASFFRDRRIAPQLALAARNGHRGSLQQQGEKLLARICALLEGHRPAASLLHGDLWAGNAARLAGGEPVVFDPAPYYGDREADLAMTELFGGFRADFYAAYRERAPLPDGYPLRRTLYNLYHVLNHLNLFGGSYRRQADAMIGELLAQGAR